MQSLKMGNNAHRTTFWNLIFFLLGSYTMGLQANPEQMVFMVEGESSGKDFKHIALQKKGEAHYRLLTGGDAQYLYPDIDATGRYVAYSKLFGERSSVVVLDLKTKLREVWFAGSDAYLQANFSGDGRFLAAAQMDPEDGHSQIVYLNIRKHRREQTPQKKGEEWFYTVKPKVLVTDAPAYFPAYASDGSFLVFQKNISATKKHIVRYDFDTKKETLLSLENKVAKSPALSYDDRWLAYSQEEQNGSWDIYVKDLRENKTFRLTHTDAMDLRPSFTARDTLVFASNRRGNFELYEMKIGEESSTAQRVVEGKYSYYSPAISGNTNYTQKIDKDLLPPPRSSFGAIEHQGKLYVVGGHQGKEHTYPPESFMAQVEIYDLKTGQWSSAAPRPTRCHGFGIAAHGKYIYAFGGFAYSKKHTPAWRSLDVIERYNIETNEWSVVGKMPRKRSSNVVAQLNGKVYLMGGWDSTPKKKGDLEGHFHREIDVFDFATETIQTLPHKIPNPLRRALSGVVVGDEILLVGGLGQGASHFELLDHVTAFKPSTGQWRELPKLPFATFAPAAGYLQGKLYVFGGLFKLGKFNYKYVNHIFSLGTDSKKWQHSGRYLSEPKGFAQVVNISSNELGLLGGHAYEGGDGPVSTFERFKTERVLGSGD